MIKVNLAVLLAERNIKISELAKHTGISRTTLTSLYYNQSKGIQFDTLDVLCTYLKVKLDQLLLYENFSYDFEMPSSLNLDEEEDIVIQCKIKIIYNGREVQDVISIECNFDGSDVLDTIKNREAEVLDYINIQVIVNDKIKNIIASLPLLVRTTFEKGLGDEVKFLLSKDCTFAPNTRIDISFV